MTNELTYEQASVLCRVPGMPYQSACSDDENWTDWIGDPDDTPENNDRNRLTPSASLTPDQAAICLAMGVAVEVHYGNGGKWRPCRIGDCCPSVHGHSTTSLRVPPESEEA